MFITVFPHSSASGCFRKVVIGLVPIRSGVPVLSDSGKLIFGRVFAQSSGGGLLRESLKRQKAPRSNCADTAHEFIINKTQFYFTFGGWAFLVRRAMPSFADHEDAADVERRGVQRSVGKKIAVAAKLVADRFGRGLGLSKRERLSARAFGQLLVSSHSP